MLKRLLLILGAIGCSFAVQAQDSTFTYQGLLTENGGPANGSHDLTFTLFNTPSGGASLGPTNTIDDLVVGDGLLVVPLDFTAAAFDGAPRWLEIAVRPGGDEGNYSILTPRQPVTPSPYALSAARLMAPGAEPLDITVAGERMLRLEPTAGAPNFVAGESDNATGIGILGASIGGGWSNRVLQSGATVGGGVRNTNTSWFGVIGGGIDNRVGDLYAVVAGGSNNVADARSSVVGGGARNTIDPFAEGATIGGGIGNSVTDRAATVGGGSVNAADGQLSTVGGGYRNIAGENYSFVGGGGLNVASGTGAFVGGGGSSEFFVERGTNHLASGEFAVVVGGKANTAAGRNSFVGGGRLNLASGDGAFVGGGQESVAGGFATNNIAAGVNAVVGGGRLNVARGNLATIPGGEANRADGTYATALGNGNVVDGFYATAVGYNNIANGNYSLAMGSRARTGHPGALVWADASPAELFSATDNSVTLRAAGGYRLFSNADASIGVSLAPNQNSWGVLSDRKRKKDLQPLDGRAILDKLAAVPISTWHYDFEPADATPHIGPMAQDFKAAFYPGRDETSITTHEFDGVALAAIQGLNQKVEEHGRTLERRLEQKETEIAELRQQNADLLRRLAELEQRLK